MYLQAGSILQKIDYQLFKMKPQKIVIAIDSFKDASPRQKPEKLPPKGYMPHVPNAGPSCSLWPTVEKACSTSCLQPVTENVSPSVPTTR